MLAGHAVAAQAQRARVLRTASSRLPTKRANPPLGLTLHSLDRSDSRSEYTAELPVHHAYASRRLHTPLA